MTSTTPPVRTVPVIEEAVHVGTVEVDRGGYRITKRVEVRDEAVDVLLREERVEIERRPIGLHLANGSVPAPRQEGDTLIVPVVEEVLVTETRLVLVEEIRITRIGATRREQQTVRLRKDAVVVERLDATGATPSAGRTKPGNTAPAGGTFGKSDMNSVLVGMFDTQSAAAQARERLMSAGFGAGAVSMTGGSADTEEPGDGADDAPREGAISRFFSGIFGDDDAADAHRAGYTDTYNEAFKRGGYGVTVTAASEGEMDDAATILNDCGAVDIDEKAESWRQDGWDGGSAATGAVAMPAATAAASTVEAGATRKLQEVEESLVVGKRAVAKGGVRIFSRVVEVPVSETVRLREEHADIQRKAVDRPATEADFAAFKEGEIEVREMAEEAVVGKTARVTGEVEIGKTATERDETVHDTVRKTQVDVERIEPATTQTTTQTTTTPRT